MVQSSAMEHGVEKLTERGHTGDLKESLVFVRETRRGCGNSVQLFHGCFTLPHNTSRGVVFIPSAKTFDADLALTNTANCSLLSSHVADTQHKKGQEKHDATVRRARTGGRIKEYTVRHNAAMRHPPVNPPPDVRPGATCHIARSHYHRRNLRQHCRMQTERCSNINSVDLEMPGKLTGLEAVCCNAGRRYRGSCGQ